ncbi:MAG: zinc-binding protein [Dictyoglomus sp. NZ13-RE01]|nr:MAG: zinc-binding protein [Dictyoglomus sp. NZ13-RE01]
MSEEVTPKEGANLLPVCTKEPEKLDIIFVCDGAASVGQIGHEVGVRLTNMSGPARMCCTSAVAAGSEPHINVGKKARRVIVINGCANKCVTKIMEKNGIKIDFDYTLTELGIKKIPTLDFSEDEVEKIVNIILKDLT